MLTTKSEEKFGKISLQQHYEKINIEGQVRNKQLSTIIHENLGIRSLYNNVSKEEMNFI